MGSTCLSRRVRITFSKEEVLITLRTMKTELRKGSDGQLRLEKKIMVKILTTVII